MQVTLTPHPPLRKGGPAARRGSASRLVWGVGAALMKQGTGAATPDPAVPA